MLEDVEVQLCLYHGEEFDDGPPEEAEDGGVHEVVVVDWVEV